MTKLFFWIFFIKKKKKSQKMENIQKKICQIDWFHLKSFLAWTFLNFLAHYAILKFGINFLVNLQHSNCVWCSSSLAPSRNTNNSLSRFDKSVFFTEIHSVLDSHINILAPVIISAFCKNQNIYFFTKFDVSVSGK